jgi:cell division protease FtsH
MSNFFNQGLLKNIISYTIIAFIISIFISSATLPSVSSETMDVKGATSLISSTNNTTINKVIKNGEQYFLELKGEDDIVEIEAITQPEQFNQLVKQNKIELSETPVSIDYLSTFFLSLNIFLILLSTSLLIIFTDFHSIYKTCNVENTSFKQHFFKNYTKLYQPALQQNLINYSNPVKNKLFLAVFIIIFSYSLSNVNTENTVGVPNTYIYSDFIADVNSDLISYVEIETKDGVTNLKATTNTNENKYFTIGNADDLKGLLSQKEVRFNEVNQGESTNYTPYIITIVIFIGVFVIFSGIAKGLASKQGGLFKGKDFKILATKPNVTLNDVKGIEEIKEEITEVVELLNNKVGTNELGGKTPKGILIDGAPGVGKTLLAKAIANETDYNFIYTNGAEFAGQLQGQGADNIKSLFETARANQPAIIFIDEIDGVGQKRGASQNSSDSDRTLNRLLVELDGFDTKEDNIIVVGATNFPDKLDPALIRAGRFDREITIPLPRYKGRLELLEYFIGKVKAESDIDLNFIAHHTSGFSGASLENLVNEAALLAARKNKKTIESEDFEEAQSKLVMGHKLPIEMSEKERWMTAYHEAGHTIIKHKSETKHMHVHKVSIIPRGKALGVTISVPDEEKFSMSKKEIEADIASLYGGRIAEELVVGEDDVSTGASNDFERATQEAEKMIKYFGLNNSSLLTLGYKDTRDSGNLTEADKTTMEGILLRNYKNAAETLSDNKVLLRELSKALMLFDTIEKDQIDRVMNGEDITITKEFPEGLAVPAEFDILLKNYKVNLFEEEDNKQES